MLPILDVEANRDIHQKCRISEGLHSLPLPTVYWRLLHVAFFDSVKLIPVDFSSPDPPATRLKRYSQAHRLSGPCVLRDTAS